MFDEENIITDFPKCSYCGHYIGINEGKNHGVGKCPDFALPRYYRRKNKGERKCH